MEVGRTSKSDLTRGASIMVVCIAIAKFLGVIWIIPVAPLLGNDGLGIYTNAYTIYGLLLTLSTSGFPNALGKLISERLALKKYAEAEQLYRVTIRAIIILSIALFLIMWFGAPFFSSLIAVKDAAKASAQITPSIRAVSFCLLVVPMMSAFRGYLLGFQKLEANAYSQALEQLFRVLTMVIGAFVVVKILHHSATVAGAATATFGAVVGGIAGLILLSIAVMPLRRKYRHLRLDHTRLTNQAALRMIFRVALPISLGALVVPISNLTDTYTIQNLLQMVGETYKEAVGNYGIYTREAMYLIQLPLAFALAIGSSVLPAISEAKALGKQGVIQNHVRGTLRSMLFITFPTVAALLTLSHPIDYVLFRSFEGAPILSTVAFMSIFSGLELISTYILQGLGKMYRPVRNMFIGIIIKVIFNIVLILTMHSIMGAAIATTIGYLVSSLLNVSAVRKYGKVKFSLFRLSSPFFVASIPLAIVLLCVNWLIHTVGVHLFGTAQLYEHQHWLQLWLLSLAQLLISLGIGAVVYLYFSMRIGAIREEEVRKLPGVGHRLAKMARKLYKQPSTSSTPHRRSYR